MGKKVVENNPTLKKVWIVFTFLSLGMCVLWFICTAIFWLIWAEPGTLAAVIKNFINWVLGLFCLLGIIMLIPGIVMRVVWAQKKEITDNKEL